MRGCDRAVFVWCGAEAVGTSRAATGSCKEGLGKVIKTHTATQFVELAAARHAAGNGALRPTASPRATAAPSRARRSLECVPQRIRSVTTRMTPRKAVEDPRTYLYHWTTVMNPDTSNTRGGCILLGWCSHANSDAVMIRRYWRTLTPNISKETKCTPIDVPTIKSGGADACRRGSKVPKGMHVSPRQLESRVGSIVRKMHVNAVD